jgi:hypothetical protein
MTANICHALLGALSIARPFRTLDVLELDRIELRNLPQKKVIARISEMRSVAF